MTAHEINHIFSDQLHVCGCGRPETTVILIKAILECMPLYDNRAKFEKLVPDEGAQHLILGLMTEADLIEHGGGIGGSWMRDEGKALLKSLQDLAITDPQFESVFDNETVWEECPKCCPEEVR